VLLSGDQPVIESGRFAQAIFTPAADKEIHPFRSGIFSGPQKYAPKRRGKNYQPKAR
jgi:hypothetical protein